MTLTRKCLNPWCIPYATFITNLTSDGFRLVQLNSSHLHVCVELLPNLVEAIIDLCRYP